MEKETNILSTEENSNDLDDRISNFPDLIITRILSLMPTKDAVVTSVLSKRWQFMWKTVNNFDFRYEEIHSHHLLPVMSMRRYIEYYGILPGERIQDMVIPNPNIRFAQFVCKILADAESINKFRLHWKTLDHQSCYMLFDIDGWIKYLSFKNVKEVYLGLHNFQIPLSVFSCQSLTSLELNGVIGISSETVVCLPRLETLKLHSVYFNSEEDFQNLISGCPVLKYLHINVAIGFMKKWDPTHEDYVGMFRFIVFSDSLRHIVMRAYYPMVTIGNCLFGLHLETPSLEYLKLDIMIFRIFLRPNRSSLFEANFGLISYVVYSQNIKDSFRTSFVNELHALSSIMALTLSRPVMEALNYDDLSFFPDFLRLKKLRVTADCLRWRALQSFIQCSDHLESVIFEKGLSCSRDVSYESNWTVPDVVPRCLSNSLKTILIAAYDCHDEQLNMMGYMLKHGSKLQMMKISCSKKFRSKFLALEKMGKLPRKSLTCKVKYC